MPFLATTKLTPPLTMQILLLSLNLRLSMPSTLPLPAISSRLPQWTPLYSVPSRTCLTTLLSFLNHLSLIGLLTMDIYITRAVCMYHLPLDPLYSTLSIPLPSLPSIIYPTFRRVFLTMTMAQWDHYISQSELPPHRSPSPIPIPAQALLPCPYLHNYRLLSRLTPLPP